MDINNKNIEDLLKDFGVNSEEELQRKLYDEALDFYCCKCGKIIKIEDLKFTKEELPICKNCGG